MTTDETASSYGLFHIAFAALDQGITDALVSLLRSKNETLAVDLVTAMGFARRVDALEKLAKTLDGQSEYVQHLRAALASAKKVSEWRNARVHPRVEFLDGIRPVLVDKDKKPLQIDPAICWEKIHQSSLALSEIEAYADRLVTDAKILEDMMNVELEQR